MSLHKTLKSEILFLPTLQSRPFIIFFLSSRLCQNRPPLLHPGHTYIALSTHFALAPTPAPNIKPIRLQYGGKFPCDKSFISRSRNNVPCLWPKLGADPNRPCWVRSEREREAIMTEEWKLGVFGPIETFLWRNTFISSQVLLNGQEAIASVAQRLR